MTAIQLNNMVKQYPGGVEAVSGVSATVHDGEFVTLVGPSGCGKTTTLRTIAGFETPTTGKVKIGDKVMNNVPPDKRNIGMVFQDFALFPHMTVEENVGYGLRVQGKDEEYIEKRVKQMLQLVELTETADRKPDQLSGGQQQRIALARALAPEPSVLLLDEPLASLDKKLRETMQVELRKIQKELDITTLLVTHNQKEALTMSDRVVVMNDGEFEQIGKPKEVYSNPATPFVADFVGTANLFNGKISEVNDGMATIKCDEITIKSSVDITASRGKSVTAAIRPENINITDSVYATDGSGETDRAKEKKTIIKGVVDLLQYNGDQVEFHIITDCGHSITSVESINTVDVHSGDEVQVSIPADKVHLFPES